MGNDINWDDKIPSFSNSDKTDKTIPDFGITSKNDYVPDFKSDGQEIEEELYKKITKELDYFNNIISEKIISGNISNILPYYNKVIDSMDNFINTTKTHIPERFYNSYSSLLFNRGVEYDKNNDKQKAYKDYSKVIQINPNSFEAYNKRGFIKINAHNFQGAMDDFECAISINPNVSNSYLGIALICAFNKDFIGVINNYNKALQLDSDSLGAYDYTNLASAYSMLDLSVDYANEIVNYYNKAKLIDLSSLDGNDYFRLADANLYLKNYGEAINDLNYSINLMPNEYSSYEHLGFTYFILKDYNASINAYNKALKLKPNGLIAESLCNLAYGKAQVMQSGDMESEIIHDYEKAINLDDSALGAIDYKILGFSYYNRKDFEKSKQALKNSYELNPNDEDVNNLLNKIEG